tara:strand:- start:79 stop:801 length:723 start_codon:yes stop_codon:yes gene_type:complete
MKLKPSVTLLVPVLNERGGMEIILPRISKDWVERILIVDGGSNDGSLEYARENGYEVFTQTLKGPRGAFLECFQKITTDYVLTFSPDGNCIPEVIPELIEKIHEGYDMVIASRYKDDAQSYDDTLLSGTGNAFFTWLISKLHGHAYTDSLNIFRIYKTKIYFDLDMGKDGSYWQEKLFFTSLGIEPLLSIRAAKKGLKIEEIAADEPNRVWGEAKVQIVRWGCAYLLQILTEFFSKKYRA